jgi:hypothetical protein
MPNGDARRKTPVARMRGFFRWIASGRRQPARLWTKMKIPSRPRIESQSPLLDMSIPRNRAEHLDGSAEASHCRTSIFWEDAQTAAFGT